MGEVVHELARCDGKQFIKRIGKSLSALVFTLVTVLETDANLIINGSFEEHPQFQNGSWGLFSAIPGWTAVGVYPIEIRTSPTYGVTGFVGNDVMELDSTGNVKVDQILATPGGSYTLSFLYARRGGVSSETCSFDVLWNGVLVTTFSPTVTPMSTVMSLFSTSVLGSTVNVLEFRGPGRKTHSVP
jgi:hypothetical protein